MLRRLLLIALFVVIATSGATVPTARANDNTGVYGTIYDIWTFTPLENSVVEVIPGPQTVAPDGTYSLSLSPGDYTITAKYYGGSTTPLYEAEENITLQEGENRLLDLIMFPTLENELEDNYDVADEEDEEEALAEAGYLWLGVVGVLIIAVIGVVIFYHRKILGLVEKEVTAASSTRVVGLPDDLNEVLNVIRESGGRINQVELRQKLPYSEAKVSLMISDLEERGLVRKIQKGRGNIIVLAELEK